MANMYYMGSKQGTKKADGSAFYVVSLLRMNRFGDWEVKPMFVDRDIYDDVRSMAFAVGTCVNASVDFDGRLVSLVEDPSGYVLNL